MFFMFALLALKQSYQFALEDVGEIGLYQAITKYKTRIEYIILGIYCTDE